MLKELNALAEALLGLEGYPTKPLWPHDAARRGASASRQPPVAPPVGAVPTNGGPASRSTPGR
ncbi:hypothetical protein [Dokdonella sp.]|uniref:hypothetical protein n=1 Tax=Dokdonella sp. TaxID=2291710 RepID=UPI002F42816A